MGFIAWVHRKSKKTKKKFKRNQTLICANLESELRFNEKKDKLIKIIIATILKQTKERNEKKTKFYGLVIDYRTCISSKYFSKKWMKTNVKLNIITHDYNLIESE